jgi:hypothetical protein
MHDKDIWTDAVKIPVFGDLDDREPHEQLHLAFH